MPLRSIPLKTWLPLLVSSLFLVIFAIMLWKDYHDHESDVYRLSLRFVTRDMALLQREMEREISTGEFSEAGQALSARGVNPEYQVLVAIDEKSLILHATRLDLKGRQTTQALPDFDAQRFTQVQQSRRFDVRLDLERQQITAYFPLKLARRTSEIRSLRTGALFLVYDLSDALIAIRLQVMRDSFLVGLLLLFAMMGLMIFLRRFVTYPTQHLAAVAQALAKDEQGALTYISGRGELADLGAAFNEMSRELLEKRVRQRTQSEEELLQYKHIASSSTDMLALLSRDCVYLATNAAYLSGIGTTTDDLIGRTPAEVFGEAFFRTTIKPRAERCLSGEEVRYQEWIKFPNAERMYMDISFSPHRGLGNEILGFVVSARDMTDIKHVEEERTKLEARVRQNQKLEAIGTLAGGVAHEINNPICGIMNYAQLINERLDPENPLREFAGEIRRESERVAGIVRNLLSFARQEKDSYSLAGFSDILNNTLSLIRTIIRRDQITIEVDIPDDLPKIKCRSQQIQQVLMNLLTNARDALNARYPEHDPEKVITVTVRPFKQADRPWIRATVEDHGPGIPVDIASHMFDPFFTTKDRNIGTGLGLSISHGIVQDHKGKLYFESKAGQYTRFYLDLPVDNGWTLDKKNE